MDVVLIGPCKPHVRRVFAVDDIFGLLDVIGDRKDKESFPQNEAAILFELLPDDLMNADGIIRAATAIEEAEKDEAKARRRTARAATVVPVHPVLKRVPCRIRNLPR